MAGKNNVDRRGFLSLVTGVGVAAGASALGMEGSKEPDEIDLELARIDEALKRMDEKPERETSLSGSLPIHTFPGAVAHNFHRADLEFRKLELKIKKLGG